MLDSTVDGECPENLSYWIILTLQSMTLNLHLGTEYNYGPEGTGISGFNLSTWEAVGTSSTWTIRSMVWMTRYRVLHLEIE